MPNSTNYRDRRRAGADRSSQGPDGKRRAARPAVRQVDHAAAVTPSRTEVAILKVSDEVAGQRLDNFLLRYLKGAPRPLIYRIIRTGEVRVNGSRVRAHTRLEAADLVRVPPLRLESTGADPLASAAARATVRTPLYEDDHLLVLDKPAGLAVHGGTAVHGGLVEQLRVLFPDQKFLELVHRLDRETSGCLLLAKNRRTLASLHELFRNGDRQFLQKGYQVLLANVGGGGHDFRQKLRVSDALVDARGRSQSAETDFIKRKLYYFGEADDKTTLIFADVRLHSGRKHQIRRHAAARNLPVAGDKRHGDFALNRKLRRVGLTRLFLHANTIKFQHPIERTMIQIDAPLPDELAHCLQELTFT